MMMVRMILAVLLLASAAGGAAAQRADATAGWPARPIKLIVLFPAGSSTDAEGRGTSRPLIGRILAQSLAVRLGQPVVIEKRAEGSGMFGSKTVTRARPDGYTLGIATTSTHARAASLSASLAYDPLRDFAPVSMIGGSPYLMVRSPQLGSASVQRLIEQAKAKPGKLAFCSAGRGSLAHLAPKRTSALPDLPTIAESGHSRGETVLSMALVAPASSPPPAVAKLNDAIRKSLDDADVKTSLSIQVFEAEPDTPEAPGDRIAADIGKWRTVVAKAGIQPE